MAGPPIAGLPVKPPFSPHSRADPERRPAALPSALAFLTEFAPVIVIRSASVESFGAVIESITKSREVMVTKNISITHQSISKDRRQLMILSIIRQAGMLFEGEG